MAPDIYALCLFWILCSGICHLSFAASQPVQESDQQISEFSLSGYGEKGKKTWDLAGRSADIFDNLVKLKEVVGNLYSQDETVNLTADRGDFDKQEGKVHLEQNVVITTSSGSRLTTDSLDWDKKNQLLTTEDTVNITRDNMVAHGTGAIGRPNLNKVVLKKDVQVDMAPKDDKIIITCDGPLEVDYAQNIATFKDNVKVDTKDNEIYSDIMHIYFLSGGKDKKEAPAGGMSLMGTKIDKIVCIGNVKIVHGENVSYSEKATYNAADRNIVLTGRPKLILNSTADLGAVFGPAGSAEEQKNTPDIEKGSGP